MRPDRNSEEVIWLLRIISAIVMFILGVILGKLLKG